MLENAEIGMKTAESVPCSQKEVEAPLAEVSAEEVARKVCARKGLKVQETSLAPQSAAESSGDRG